MKTLYECVKGLRIRLAEAFANSKNAQSLPWPAKDGRTAFRAKIWDIRNQCQAYSEQKFLQNRESVTAKRVANSEVSAAKQADKFFLANEGGLYNGHLETNLGLWRAAANCIHPGTEVLHYTSDDSEWYDSRQLLYTPNTPSNKMEQLALGMSH